MNSIQEKRNSTIHEKQFDKALQETKNQIEQINKGIDVKKHLGENTYCHYTYDKKYYIDEVIKYFEGKNYHYSGDRYVHPITRRKKRFNQTALQKTSAKLVCTQLLF